MIEKILKINYMNNLKSKNRRYKYIAYLLIYNILSNINLFICLGIDIHRYKILMNLLINNYMANFKQ